MEKGGGPPVQHAAPCRYPLSARRIAGAFRHTPLGRLQIFGGWLRMVLTTIGPRSGVLPISEAGGTFGDAAEELHRLDPEGEAFAVLTLVHVEARELADAVEAVADGVAVGVEVRGGADGRGVVAEVGDEGLDELRAVAGVVADDGLQGLPVEGLQFFRVLLQDAEEELVGARALERRDRGGALDAVADLEGYLGLGVGVGEEGRVRLVAADAHRDRQVREEALYVALHALGEELRLL